MPEYKRTKNNTQTLVQPLCYISNILTDTTHGPPHLRLNRFLEDGSKATPKSNPYLPKVQCHKLRLRSWKPTLNKKVTNMN
jgi:hypothetical protein